MGFWSSLGGIALKAAEWVATKFFGRAEHAPCGPSHEECRVAERAAERAREAEAEAENARRKERDAQDAQRRAEEAAVAAKKKSAAAQAEAQRQAEEARRRVDEERQSRKRIETELARLQKERQKQEEKIRQKEWERDHYKEPDYLRETPGSFHLGVIGSTGVGKSSLVGHFLELSPVSDDFPKVGETQTTLEPMPFHHHSLPGVIFWDLPGAGTNEIPTGDAYIQKYGLRHMHAAIVVTAERFRKVDGEVYTHLQRHQVPTFVARTKIDQAAESAEEGGKDFGQVKATIIKSLVSNGIDPKHIYLVAGRWKHQQGFDLPRLRDDLRRQLHSSRVPEGKAPDLPGGKKPKSKPSSK